MSIQYYQNLSDEVRALFKLDTSDTSYVIGVVDEEQFLGHIYYGQRLNDHRLTHLLRIKEPPFVPSKNNRDRCSFLDSFPMEYPAGGLGDYRESCISIETKGGNMGLGLCYVSHRIFTGKPSLSGLPASFGNQDVCSSLEILCEDSHTGVKVWMLYTVFEDVDIITRSATPNYNINDRSWYS